VGAADATALPPHLLPPLKKIRVRSHPTASREAGQARDLRLALNGNV